MNLDQYKDEVMETVVGSMLSYMADCIEDDGECAYTAEDVENCKSLMFDYLDALGAMTEPTDEAIMEQVKNLVLALNRLNEKVGYSMIETGEREAIWEIIQNSAEECGLQDPADDVTEEWREW